MIRNYKQNYKTNVKGFSYGGFENIKNFNSKLKNIGLCEDLVPNKGVVYLYLIKYLRVVTKDQLAELSDLLRREIHKAIKRLNELEKGSFLVNIESDVGNVGNVYYMPDKRADNYLAFYTDVAKLNHFSKVNDFYLSLFKNSDCTGLTIEYEVDVSEGMFSDEHPAENRLLADGFIRATHKGVVSTIYLELDNDTVGMTSLSEKLANYYNVCLHKKSIFKNEACYFVFRLDKKLYKEQFWLCRDNAINRDEYASNLRKCQKYKELRSKAKECKNEIELETFIKDNKIVLEDFKFSSGTFTANRNRFCNYLSSLKSGYEYKNEKLKRDEVVKYTSKTLTNKMKNFKNKMLEEFDIVPFHFVSENSIYSDITRKTTYASMYEKIEGKRVLLRTNFFCGGANVDKWMNEFLYNEDDWLVKLVNDTGWCDFHKSKKREQAYYRLDGETLCFSNLIRGVRVGNDGVDVPFSFALLMPTISISDHARICYIFGANPDEIELNLGNERLVLFVITDNKKDRDYYLRLLGEYEGNERLIVLVRQIDF